tara:strand:- start:931 stop:1158 length:228 start_codon:yes stop_codon:yes gene_type:complete
MQMYNQCRLRKGNAIQVSWIPSEFAKENKYVRLKENGEWTDGWKVLTVGAGITAKALKENEQRVRSGAHRKATDI